MAIRSIHNDIRNAFLTEEPFVYAHLVKFERPISAEGGLSNRKANDYIYISDGSFDISFDDGSEDLEGNANGAQTYVANKLVKVGAVQETIEARATTLNLQVSGAALSTSLQDSINLTSSDGNGKSTITSSENLVEAGFREGDLVELSGSGANNGKTVRIESFSTNNTVANVETVGTAITAQTAATYTLTLKNPEVEGIITNRASSSYARYINREVFVYKAFINPETGAIIGTPYLLFKGIIAGGKLTEDPTKRTLVSWNVTSHWGDFARVQGRLTSDPYHRALDQNNVPDPQAAIRPSYVSDLGFLHSETAINLVAIYQVQETRTKLKMKRKWYGSKKYKLIEYQVEVDREADLRFNLEAKYLPVVYGINKIDSIPVFVDTLNNDAKKVFVAYAICEGRVGGLYDIYFDDTSSICIDENDKDTRSTQTEENTIDVLCQGRADRGDTLTPQVINSATSAIAPASGYAWGTESWREERRIAQEIARQEYPYYVPLAVENIDGGATSQGAGITHERGTKFSTPIDSILTFHAGLSNQKANSTLLSNANNFKVATDYYSGTDPYWGAQHQLLDTAYVVAQYTIGEGETTIPSLDFVVRGKGVECFNYDFSYAKNPAYTSDNAANFNIGDEVDIYAYTGSGYSLYTEDVVIADIFNITTVEGTLETRVRFKTDPGVSPWTDFYMTDGTNNFHMVAWNHVAETGSCPGALQEEITTVANTTVSGGTGVDITVSNGNPSSAYEWLAEVGDTVGIVPESEQAEFTREDLDHFYNAGTITNGTIQNIGTTQQNSSELVTSYVTLLDGMRLASGASSTNDAYNNYFIEVTHTYDDNSTFVQKRRIIDYDGASRTVKVNAPFEQAPIQNDTYKIYSTNGDIRVSTNPAMQLLDYLMDDRYGRNLKLALASTDEGDIDGPSVFQAGRDCDTRSNIHVLATTSAASNLAEGAIYKYTANSKTLFHGKVKSISTVGSFKSIEFEEVLGKLNHRWEDWKYFYTGELYYHQGGLHKATSDGTVSTPSTTSSASSSDVTLTKVSGTGPTSLVLDYDSSRVTFEGNPLVKKYTSTGTNSGYSLYDSDDVKYWRYLGWEAQNQRHVTRHQTNAVIDTASPVFDNINSMLKHFNGVLRYSNGKYNFAVMQTAGATTSVTIDGETYSIDVITDDDIIGSIDVEDVGQKGTYNQVDVGINDPQNRFEGRSVMMFNSDYLKQDRMVPRKGTFQAPYVTNYYNARINAKQYLDQARSGLKINFTMGPKGALLLAGEVIKITYPRLGWTTKHFRITNLTIKENCLVQVTAEEHDDSTFIVGATNRGQINSTEGVGANPAGLGAPSGLSATTDRAGGILLSWTNSSGFTSASYSTQVWSSSDNDRSNAVLLDTTKSNTYTDFITEDGGATKYYWVRHVALVPPQTGSQTGLKEIFSPYFPLSETAGVQGSAGDIRAQRVDLTFDQHVVSYSAEGTTPDVSSVTMTAAAQGFTDPYFKFTGGGNNFTDDTAFTNSDETDENTEQRTFTVPTSYSSSPYNFTVEVKEGGSGDVLATDTGTVVSVKPGGSSRSVSLNMGDQTFEYTIDGDTPTPTNTTVTATPINTVGTVFYQFFIDGTAVSGYATPQSGTGANEFTYTPQSAFTDMPQEIKVEIREGSASSAVVATDVIIALGLKDGADALTVVMPNHSHSVPQDKAGNITFTGSGTTIELWEGTNQLVYDGTGTSADAGKWKIDDRAAQTIVTNVTQPSNPYTDQGNYVEVAALSGFSSTANTGSIKYKIVGKRANGNLISLEATQSFTKTVDGQGTITVALDNPSHVVNAATNGTVADFGDAGTTISVFEGSDQLNYEPSGNDDYDTAGTWTVSSSGSGITPDSITESGNDAVLGDTPSNMTGDNATITLSVSGKRLDGTPFTASAKQTISKARNGQEGGAAKTVRLFASSYAIPYTAAGTTSAGDITLTADALNFDDPYFKFEWDGTDNANTFQDDSTWTDSNETDENREVRTFTPPTAYSATPATFTVTVKEGGASGSVVATDTLSVFSVKAGADNKQLVVTSDHDNYILRNSGTVSPSNVEFTANKINLTGTPTWSSSVPLYATASSTTALSGSGLNRDNVFVKTSALGTTASVSVSASLTENSVTYSDTESIERLTDASEEIVVSLSNDNVTLSANSDGEVISHTGSGTTIQVHEGTTRLDWDNAGTTASHYKVTPSLVPSNAGATIGTPYSTQNLLDVTYPDLSGIPDNTSSFVVRYVITGKRANGTSFNSTVDQTINVVNSGQDGEDALTMILTNPTHAIPVTTTGSLDYSGSGTTIKVFEGSTPLDYDAAGNTAGHWKLNTPTPTTDSEGNNTINANSTISDSGNDAVIGVANSLLDDTAAIVFEATGQRADGTAFTISQTQTFARANRGSSGINAQGVDIRADSFVISYDETGKNPTPSSITLTAEAKNVTDPYFKFIGGGSHFSNDSTWADSNETDTDTEVRTFTAPTDYREAPYNFTVSVKDGGNGSELPVVATDTLSIASVKPGTGALTAVLDNDNHSIPQTAAGALDFTGSVTNVKVYEGAEVLTYEGDSSNENYDTAGYWYISTITDVNVTSPALASAFNTTGVETKTVDVKAITAFASGENSGSRTFTIEGKRLDGTDFSFTRSQSFTRTVDGTAGVNGVALNGSATSVTFNKDGSTYDPNTTSTITVSASGATITAVTYTASSTGYMTVSNDSTTGCTVTFGNNMSLAQVNTGNFVTAAFTGTTSDGTTGVNLGSLVIPISTTLNGVNGVGTNGLRTIQGYLYYEKETAPGTAPSAPASNNSAVVYNFSGTNAGLVTGTGVSTSTAVDTWMNYPRPQDPTSSNVHYTVRYYGIEASAGASSCTLTFSPVVQHTNFTGVVTFSNGTFSDGGTAIDGSSDATSIDGGNIKTNSIKADQLEISASSSGNETMFFDGTNNRIEITDASGNPRVRIGNLATS